MSVINNKDSFLTACYQSIVKDITNLCISVSGNLQNMYPIINDPNRPIYTRIDAMWCVGKMLTKHTPLATVPDFALLQTTLDIVLEDFNGCINPDNTLSIPVTDVVLEDNTNDFNFGDYSVRISPYSYLTGKSHCIYSVYTLSPEHTTHNGKSSYSHPHICGNALCEGEGHVGISNALKRYDLVSFYLMVESILRNYCAAAAYKPLSYWTNSNICAVCGDNEVTASCDYCSTQLCDDCYVTCRSCDNYLCENCTTYCHVCDYSYCPDCAELKRCNYCGRDACEGCRRECGICGNIICAACDVEECSDCGELICPDCVKTCNECGCILCKTCITSVTDDPNQLALFETDLLGKNYCTTCAEELGEKLHAKPT